MTTTPPPVGPDLRIWANQLVTFLKRSAALLRYKDATMTPAINGSIVWNEEGKYPEVARDGLWREILTSEPHGQLLTTVDVVAAAPNTGYGISWDTPPDVSFSISVSGSVITFEEGGRYRMSFGVQMKSSTASAVDFFHWVRKNGTDIPQSSIRCSLHNNNQTLAVSRTTQLEVEAGDEVQLMWAVSNVDGFLSAEPATAFAPGTPSVVLAFSKVAA